MKTFLLCPKSCKKIGYTSKAFYNQTLTNATTYLGMFFTVR